MDYGNRADTLGTSDFFKPETGNYILTFLGEGKPRMGTFNKGEPNERTVAQLEFPVKVDNQEYTWTVTEAKAFNSLYGQIMLLGRFHGSLEGKAIHMTVQGDGKKRVYMIQEATDLVKKAEDARKAKLEAQKSQPAPEPEKPADPPAEKKEAPAEGSSAIDEIFAKKFDG